MPNDSDQDGDSLTVTKFVVAGRTYIAGSSATITGIGSNVLNKNGSYTFTTLPTYVGQVPSIRYTITDGNEIFARAYLRIVVIPLVNPPQLLFKDTSICENEIVSIKLASLNVENPIYTFNSDSLLTNQVFSGSLFTTPTLTQTTTYYVRLNGSNLLPALNAIVKKITITGLHFRQNQLIQLVESLYFVLPTVLRSFQVRPLGINGIKMVLQLQGKQSVHCDKRSWRLYCQNNRNNELLQ